MRLLSPAALVVLSVLAAAPAASAATPPPTPVAPSAGHEYPPPLRAVTFKVEGQPQEQPGALRIEFTDPDGTRDETGRYQNDESGVDDYALQQVDPGGTLYRVKVPASAFRRYSDKNFRWHPYRLLPAGSCTPIQGSMEEDCFQEGKQRRFSMLEPAGYGAYEPNNSRRRATPSTEFFNHDCAYLEKRSDVDWYRYRTKHRLKLRLRLQNFADSDRWTPLKSRKRESADMSVSVYRGKSRHKLASMHVAVGKTKVLRTKLRAKRNYLFAFRHAGNGHKHAKHAANMSYAFDFNFPGPFSDANGCT
jgi:hypothetical protein